VRRAGRGASETPLNAPVSCPHVPFLTSVPVSRMLRRARPRPSAAPLAVLATVAALGAASCATAPEPVPQTPLPKGGTIVRISPEEAAVAVEAVEAEMSVETAPGLRLRLWASEALLSDPIGIAVDERGQVFVTGSSRSGPLLDIRGHPTWRTPSLAMRTTEDMRVFLRRELAPERSDQNPWLPDLNGDGVRDWRDLTVRTERVYRLLDTSGDGRADLSQVMYEGFDTEVTDVAGGIAVHGGEVFIGAAPDVWRMRDTTGDGLLDVKESISHGYGVHPGFFGHGVSGVTMGPDGRLYWSVGDMGFSVVDREGRRSEYPNQGAIFRSEPDGSGFEVFAIGLRNTHEFTWDEWGNLVSVDNDGDHPGETERVVYIVEGSDSGWRVNWQFGKYTDARNNPYQVWMQEGLFRPRFEGQAAYITPPIAAYHAGPTGMVYNPGTALGERWRNHFLVAAFTGSPSTARINAFRLVPEGAGFRMTGDTVVVRGLLATGIAWGPEGSLYLADWVQGWNSAGNGRVWKLEPTESAGAVLREETRRLLARDLGRAPDRELARLLRHDDMRVRTRAQFALADRNAAHTLRAAAMQGDHRLARVHAVWGLGQMARRDGSHADPLVGLLRDGDAEIRAQAAKTLGDLRHSAAAETLLPLLADDSPRVRFFAAEALGRIGHAPAKRPIAAMLAANDDRDVYLRHAGALALARIGDTESVAALSAHPSAAVRLAAVVALRRMRDAGIARFLGDADPHVVTEAARAINDDGAIEPALPALARLLEQPRFASEPLLRRAISANLRVATPEAARRLAAFAERADAAEPLRVEAIASLGVWGSPSPLDRVDGMYLGVVERDPTPARMAMSPLVERLLPTPAPAVQVAVAEAIGRLEMRDATPALLARLRTDASPAVRVAALRAIDGMRSPEREEAVAIAVADAAPEVRTAALATIPTLGLPAPRTTTLLAAVLERGTPAEQQGAVAALGRIDAPEAHRVLGRLLDRMNAGSLPREIRLELAEAIDAGTGREAQTRLARIRAALPENATDRFADAMYGGNAARGRQIALTHEGAQCIRCHTFDDRASEVGPPLRRIGGTLDRRQLLEALVEPAARIAPGYGMVSLRLRDGRTLTGQLADKDGAQITVQTGDGERHRVPRGEIAARAPMPSAMPPMGQILTRREIRDVVEYMSTLR
jgi:quinoprotein glucose dehydrogenase